MKGISARSWQRVTTASAVFFFGAISIAAIGSFTAPGFWNFSTHPAACGSVIALLFVAIVAGFGSGFVGSARSLKEASYGYTTLSRLGIMGLEVRSGDGRAVLQAAPRSTR